MKLERYRQLAQESRIVHAYEYNRCSRRQMKTAVYSPLWFVMLSW